MIVADSDVLIDFLRGRDPGASRVAALLAGGGLRTTVVSQFELLSGVASPKQRTRVRELLALLDPLPLDAAAADAAAQVRHELGARGQTIGMADDLIAGVVLSRSATLLTRNRCHFGRIPGLPLADLPAPA